MIFWGDKPFARLALVLIIGIVISRYFSYYDNSLYFITGVLFLLFILSTYNTSRYREYWTGSILLLLVFIGGYTRYSMVHPNMDDSHYSHYILSSHMYGSAEILTIPKKTTRYSSFIQVNTIGSHPDSMINVTGKMAAYFKLEDSLAAEYKPGDEILFNGYLTELRHSRNPNAFDFNDFLKTKHIFYRIDIQRNMHKDSKRNLANPLEKFANNIRSHALNTFDKYLENKDHNSLMGAMVLGFRNTIDPELYASYTKTGAVHVLAVSGLHVGILCQMLLLVLNYLFKSSNREKVIKLLVLCFCTATYVIITGASAAVMRASVMILIYYIGKYWADRVNSYNVISLAAFLIMIYDPYMLFQASFQFSFLALLSIIYFYRKIYESLFTHIELKSRVLNYIWQLIALSFSAQILVAPLTVYYFHKFPIYFWLSGIVAVPAAYIVLLMGIMMIAIEYLIPSINFILDYMVTFVFEIFIAAIQTIEKLPYSTIENLWLYTHELILLYCSLLLFIIGRYTLKGSYIIGSSCLILAFTISRYYYDTCSSNQASITIFDKYTGHVIDFYDGKECYNISSVHLPIKRIEYITSNNRVNKKINTVTNISDQCYFENNRFIKNKNLIQFLDKSILILDSNYIDQHTMLSIDIAIITGGIKSKIDSIQKYVLAEKWIITQSEKTYKQKKWMEWCSRENKDCTTIEETGAHVIDIKKN